MANSHYSKTLHLPCKSFSMAILLVYLLLVGSCTAIRTGATMRLNEGSELLRRKQQQPRFPYKGLVFNFLPKGVPIPPSGPSKRHNSVVASTPKNWVDQDVHFTWVSPIFSSLIVGFWIDMREDARFAIRYRSSTMILYIRSLEGLNFFGYVILNFTVHMGYGI